MKVPFKGGYKITQKYGERPEYYSQFGLKGHEGLDIVPSDNDTDIYAIEGGVVVRDFDDPRQGGNYGNTVVIWNKENRRAWWYCHNSINIVDLNETIKQGEKISKQGATGNVSGPHLHLGLRKSDANGNAIDLENGYKGFIDPLKVLEGVNGDLVKQEEEQKKIMDDLIKCTAEKDKLEKDLSELRTKYSKEIQEKQNHIEEIQKSLAETTLTLTNSNNQVTQLSEQLKRFEGIEQALVDARKDIEILKQKLGKDPLEAYSSKDLIFAGISKLLRR